VDSPNFKGKKSKLSLRLSFYPNRSRQNKIPFLYAPSLIRPYEDSATQTAIWKELGGMAIVSGHFKALQTANLEVKVTYSIDQYLLLLNTYSPHLKLEPQRKQNLFEGLRKVLEQHGNPVELSYVSAFHIMRPNWDESRR
jgi:hypothetical protein